MVRLAMVSPPNNRRDPSPSPGAELARGAPRTKAGPVMRDIKTSEHEDNSRTLTNPVTMAKCGDAWIQPLGILRVRFRPPRL